MTAEIREAMRQVWHQAYEFGRQHGREEVQHDETRRLSARSMAQVHVDVALHDLKLDDEDAPDA